MGRPFAVGGQTFDVPPATLGVARRTLEHLRKVQGADFSRLTPEHIDALVEVFYAGLAKATPAITREELADLLPVAGLGLLVPEYLRALGMEPKASPGEAVSP